MKVHAIACALVASLAASVASAQQDFSNVEVKSAKVAEGVYMLTGAGGNIGVFVGEDGVVVIDDEYAPLAPKIKAAIAQLSSKPVRFLINTHYHQDHTGGNEAFGTEGSIIVAHENVRRRLSEGSFIKLFNMKVPPQPKAALPIVTFTDDVKIHYNGDDLDIFHVANAHTDGDALVMFTKANVIHMGDLMFSGFYPFIDTGGGGSINGMIAGEERVLKSIKDDTRVIPGHGPLATKADLKKTRDMLVTVSDRVTALIKAGKTADEAIAAAPTKDLDPTWGKGFMKPEVFVKIVYDDLKRTVK